MQWEEELRKVEELYRFLQGHAPDGYSVDENHIPNLDDGRAWTVIWYLGNLYWKIPDTVEKCDSCGDLYHSDAQGVFKEEGEVAKGSPYGFRCDDCAHEFEEDP